MSNHIDRADHIPNSTFVLDPCLGPSLKRKRAKQLKQVARTAKTLQCRGRTCRFQSRTGFQPTSERTFPRCPLPSQVPFGLVPAQASLCNLRSSLAGLPESTLPPIPEGMLTPVIETVLVSRAAKARQASSLKGFLNHKNSSGQPSHAQPLSLPSLKDSLALLYIKGSGWRVLDPSCCMSFT